MLGRRCPLKPAALLGQELRLSQDNEPRHVEISPELLQDPLRADTGGASRLDATVFSPPDQPSALTTQEEWTAFTTADALRGDPSKDSDDSEYLPNPFGLKIPRNRAPFDYSHKKHCDVLRHLKIPATPRRLDTYMRPEYILQRPKTSNLATNDQLLTDSAREKLYQQGVDIYGCYALDTLVDLKDNLSDYPVVRGTGPWHDWQGNSQGILGIDIYSRLVSKTWKGGQLHLSFTWPEALNGGPIYSYGNTLNPAGLGTRQYQGYFYTDVGRSREDNPRMQGPRIFEYWIQQQWGRNNLNSIRLGAINPWITFNKSLVAGIFSFWAFDEPGVIGTTPSTANGPLVVTAPPGVSVEGVIGDNLTLKAMVASGYWDPSGGIENRRGYKQYWNLNEYGLEFFYEATWRGGTYSNKANDNGLPWFVRIGGQNHTGVGLDNLYDIDGNYFFLTDRPRQRYRGNSQYYAMVEAMLYREPGSYNRGLTGFLKGKWSPWQRRGSTTKGIYGGLAYEGIFGRDHDVFYMGYAHMLVNDGVIERSLNQPACTEVPGCKVSDFQGVFEVGYSAQITPYLFIQPKLYYILNPNVRRDLGDLFSFGLEIRVSL